MEEAAGLANASPRSQPQINMFRGEDGEQLFEGHSWCASGYLLWPGPTVISLYLSVLEAEIRFWFDHLLITNFIGPRSKLGFLEPRLETLNTKIKQGKVTINHEVGHGYVYLKCGEP